MGQQRTVFARWVHLDVARHRLAGNPLRGPRGWTLTSCTNAPAPPTRAVVRMKCVRFKLNDDSESTKQRKVRQVIFLVGST